jgi:hypothetical protein
LGRSLLIVHPFSRRAAAAFGVGKAFTEALPAPHRSAFGVRLGASPAFDERAGGVNGTDFREKPSARGGGWALQPNGTLSARVKAPWWRHPRGLGAAVAPSSGRSRPGSKPPQPRSEALPEANQAVSTLASSMNHTPSGSRTRNTSAPDASRARKPSSLWERSRAW